jgi:DNA-directed RNA polymerase specialized sigma24 family protein
MRPHAHATDHQKSCHFSLVTNHYLRYILIRCLAYTNDRAVAQRIAVYTLITSCILSRRLGAMADLGLVIETMVQIVGDDQVISDKRQAISERNVIPSAVEESGTDPLMNAEFPASVRHEADDAPLLFVLSAPLCDVAGAVNAVARFSRELLVLHHVEGLSTAALAGIHEMPVERIETALADAEREFVELLRELSAWDHAVEPDIHGVLNALAACLNEECATAVAECARQYLAVHRW